MRKRIPPGGYLAPVTALCLFVAVPSVAKPTYTTFTLPDAQVIYAGGLNDSGVVAGTFDTATQYHRGYLRLADGTIVLFDPAGSQLTQPLSLNNNGDIAGYFYDGTTYHGFLRASDGSIATIDPPGATQSEAVGINSRGTIAGYFEPGSHGYLRTPDGNFTVFDAPGAAETIPQAINDNGDVTGSAYFSNNLGNPSGFIRMADGTLSLFDVPGAIEGTLPTAMSNGGRIVGYYEPTEATATGFERAPDGKIQTFTFPKARVVFPGSIKDSGSFLGIYYHHGLESTKGEPHAFFAKSLHRTRIFNAPACKYTYATSMNAAHAIAGSCSDVPLGFIRTP
jgi:hypothetical protein